ncbi:PREDICTED: uncharacterized protein LOC106815163 [Priapulus caudatus]|uniref:Uncharacterized protein LOC106815163 n=1 Tax=Priapulus caudatus TaxID=37621 RepID=A0ABM1ESA9_PRICU|nr:PREDICTED: uncharacterized protein LOC106815163 [Priapulus caudatus]
MFCSQCGLEVTSTSNYCSNCGILVKTSIVIDPGRASTTTSSSTTNRPSVSFEDFRKIKEDQRQSRFQPKAKRSRPGKALASEPKDVAINIGIKKYVNGYFKNIRGKCLPIRVAPSANASLVKEKAVLKHTNHDVTLDTSMDSDYVLLYPDGSLVENIPGSQQPFKLQDYKEEVGKNYNRITLYIALKVDYILAETTMGQLSSSSESDTELVDLEKIIFDRKSFVNASPAGASSTASGGPVPIHTVIIDEAGTSTATASTTITDVEDDSMALVECPICSEHFPLRIIADHADICADIWVGNNDEEEAEHPIGEEDVSMARSNDSLNDVISSLVPDLSTNKPMKLRIRRTNLWVDVQRYGPKLSPQIPIKVEFIGETAVDDGGPRREFFSEILAVIDRTMFREGKPLPSTIALNNGNFLLAGKLMVMSIVQGGPAPAYLHPTIYAYLSGQPLSSEDSVGKYRHAALKIQSVTYQDELADVLMSDDVFDVLEEIGYTGVV